MSPFSELKIINSLLISSNLTYWLDFGCLLKWHRDKKLDKSDIDFGIMLKDYDKLKEVLEKNKEQFDMIHYRDKEISLKINGVKFDFICFVKKDNDLLFYAYKQNPYCYNKWNYEWRGIFPYDIYFPLQTMHIKNLEIPVPNNIEKKIELQYGQDWRTPKPEIACWTYELNQVKDLNYHPLAIVMTTFLRDDVLLKVLPSYLKYPVKLYLLDQGAHSEIKDKYYSELREKGHFIEYSNFDMGLSASRNYLLKHVEEEFVLLTEDDVELTTNPYSLFQKFSNNNLGILGGLLIRNNSEQHYEYGLSLKDGVLEYKKSDKIDTCLNFFLAKRRVFDDILYDEELKLSEHTAFFLKLKELNKWKVNYTNELKGNHLVFPNEEYKKYRIRASDVYFQLMLKKFNIEKIIKDGTTIFNSKDFSKMLTVFVISCGKNPNYDDCLDALNNQTISFKLDIIKNINPMSSAFQEMLNRCQTPYYCQIDEDMILNPNAIKTLYDSLYSANPKTAISCFKLFDPHLNKNIDGVKIYNHNILKNYPYNNVLSCEMDQIQRFQKDGYSFIRSGLSIGLHSPKWTTEGIFERYYNYIEKYKKQKKIKEQHTLLQKLFNGYNKSLSKTDLYAFLGGLYAYNSAEIRTDEKNYLNPIIKKFPNLDAIFDGCEFQNQIETAIILPKIKVLQISGIPCAGRPWEINNLINKYSQKYESHHVLGCQYSTIHKDIPYREFPYEYILPKDFDAIVKLIEEADIIHVHHKAPKQLMPYLKNKKIVFTVSNLSNSLTNINTKENEEYNNFIKEFATIITTTDEPFQMKAYEYLTNIYLPLVKCYFDESIITNNIPRVCYAPTNRRLDDITSKGYYRVLGIIYKLKFIDGLQFDFDLIEGTSYLENLERKKKADILIDDVLQETYHNTSIEALCFNALAFTNYNKNYPFIKTDINTLEQKLKEYILDKNKIYTERKQIQNWKNMNYTPEKLLLPYEDVYATVLTKTSVVPINIEPPVIPEIKQPIQEVNQLILNNQDILNNLVKSNINFCLLEKSCAEAIKYKALKSPLIIGVFDFTSKEQLAHLCKDIKIVDIKTKKINLYNQTVNVPMPVLNYLRKMYGENWEKHV